MSFYTTIETHQSVLLAFIDFGSARVSHRPRCFRWMKIFPPPPQTTAFLLPNSAEGRTGETKFTSIKILWAEWTNSEQMRQKNIQRSFTNTAKQKLSIGPTSWLGLLIEVVAVSVLVIHDCDVSQRGKSSLPALAIVVTRNEAENLPRAFSLMKIGKRQLQGEGKEQNAHKWISWINKYLYFLSAYSLMSYLSEWRVNGIKTVIVKQTFEPLIKAPYLAGGDWRTQKRDLRMLTDDERSTISLESTNEEEKGEQRRCRSVMWFYF